MASMLWGLLDQCFEYFLWGSFLIRVIWDYSSARWRPDPFCKTHKKRQPVLSFVLAAIPCRIAGSDLENRCLIIKCLPTTNIL